VDFLVFLIIIAAGINGLFAIIFRGILTIAILIVIAVVLSLIMAGKLLWSLVKSARHLINPQPQPQFQLQKEK